jgi:hypothetical protein
MAADVCRRRAEVDFLEHRLEGTDPWGTGIGWSRWYETRTSRSSKRTWKEHYKGTAEGMEQATRELRDIHAELVAAQAKANTVKTVIEIASKVGAVVAGIVGAAG